MKATRTLLFGLLAALAVLQGAAADDSATADGISLELIMSNPDWLGRQPEEAWWAWDGQSLYYRRKREGEDIRDLYEVPASGGESSMVEDAARTGAGAPGGELNADGSLKAFTNNGDVFVRDMRNGSLHQLTRTTAEETDVRFMADGRSVAYRDGDTWYVQSVVGGGPRQVAEVKAEKDPLSGDQEFDYLKDEAERLSGTLREDKRKEDAKTRRDREIRSGDRSRVPPPFYLGDKVSVQGTSLSPSGRYLLVITRAADYDEGKHDQMPNYVTRSGYVEEQEVRTLVGRDDPAPESVLVLDLAAHEQHQLDLSRLPGIKKDPLSDLRKEALEWHVKHGADREKVKKALKAPDTRPVRVWDAAWTNDGSRLAIQFQSVDNKDRWIATVNFDADYALETQNRLTDDAWINWIFNDFGWLQDNRTLWYLSEESGYSQLYVKPVDGHARQLTHGDFEVSSPVATRDGKSFYVVANRQAPGWHDIYRVSARDGAMQRITDVGIEPATRLGGWGGEWLPFRLSPDESEVLFYDGSTTRPPELKIASTTGDARPLQLTHTISDRFKSIQWTEPKVVKVPSSHVDRPIYARLYLPRDFDADAHWPAVVFIHGAGYLQNAHSGWSDYFREFMFQTLLNRHGYVVLDMDYRASKGYGRDWRTAIYRNMGHPELEDILDGVHWLESNYGVDKDRVGVYGGSYGGFMTFMCLFRAPGTFAAGAALRPVSDWMHYNHGYTSAILNTPLVDPMAYAASSPIEFAGQYDNTPLDIFHGMQDNNVFFQDTVRLVQRLIELKKENFYPMFYPLDPHGFIHPKSWLDEYRRIFALFERYVKPE